MGLGGGRGAGGGGGGGGSGGRRGGAVAGARGRLTVRVRVVELLLLWRRLLGRRLLSVTPVGVEPAHGEALVLLLLLWLLLSVSLLRLLRLLLRLAVVGVVSAVGRVVVVIAAAAASLVPGHVECAWIALGILRMGKVPLVEERRSRGGSLVAQVAIEPCP